MAYNTFSPIVTDGLVFCTDPLNVKSFDGSSLYDIVDNTRVGTLTNGVYFGDKSFIFDGTDDYVDFGLMDIVFGSTPDITIDIFLYLNSNYQESYADIIDYEHVSGGFVIQQYFPNPYSDFYFAYWNGSSYDLLFMTLPLDSYFNLTVVKSGSDLYGYIDGVLLYQTTGSSNMTASGLTLHVGNNVSGYGRYINGNISNVKIYNRALSSDEILYNYNSLKWKFI